MQKLTKIKEKLGENKPVIGACALFTDCCVSELMGYVGFDFVWIDAEHGPLDRKEILQHIIAAHAAGAAAFVRVPWNDPVLVKPILDMGPDGIVFPFIRNAEEARLAVSSCTYPAGGIRGFNPIRAVKYGAGSYPDYIRDADSLIWKIIQIEHVDAVDNLEGILAVDGVDTVFVGPVDLSGSMGMLMKTGSAEVQAMLDKIGEIASKHNKPLGAATGYGQDNIRMWTNRGVKWITVGQDVNMLSAQCAEALKKAKEAFEPI